MDKGIQSVRTILAIFPSSLQTTSKLSRLKVFIVVSNSASGFDMLSFWLYEGRRPR